MVQTLKLAISWKLVDKFHYRYKWDEITIKEIYEFADSFFVSREMMMFVAEAIAYAIDLLEDVPIKTIKGAFRKKKKRILTKEEIESKIVVLDVETDELKISSYSVDANRSSLEITIELSGRFSF